MGLKYAILGLLNYRDLHGYRIKKHIENHFGLMWSINYGQIYPNLKKMSEEGLVTIKEVTQVNEKGPHRKMYSITEKGKIEFIRWLESSPDKGMILRDPFLMRFVFFSFGSRQRALELIDEQLVLYKKQLEKRVHNKDRWQNHNQFVRLIAQLGMQQNEVFLEWLRYAREEIAQSTDEEFAASAAAFFS